MKNFGFICVAALILCADLKAQKQEFVFTNYTQNEGLPSSETYQVFEDFKHYIWIATDLGVTRFDGNRFQTFDLPDNVVFKIRGDNKGRIWFFSHKGLLAYFENEKIHPFKYNQLITDRIDKIHIIDCTVDEQGNVFLNSFLDSNYVISPDGNIQAFSHHSNNNACLEFNIASSGKTSCFTTMAHSPRSIYSDSILITITGRKNPNAYKLKALPGRFTHYGSVSDNAGNIYFFAGRLLIKLPASGKPLIKEMAAKIINIGLFKNNLIVGMTKSGAAVLGIETLENNGDTILPNKSITCITSDYEGGLWLSTLENGVYHVKNPLVSHLVEVNMSDIHVSRMLSVRDKYLVYSKSTGLYKFDESENALFFKYNNLTGTDIFDIDDGNLYVFGSVPEGLIMENVNIPHFNKVYLYDTPSEHVTLPGSGMMISTPASVNRISFKNVGSFKSKPFTTDEVSSILDRKKLLSKQARLLLDTENKIWAGCNDGLYVLNKQLDTLLKFPHHRKLLDKGISCIRQMNNGLIAVGVRFSGIALISDTGVVANITESNGLLSNKIRYILPLHNQLWTATAKGISVIIFTSFNPVRYKIIDISKADGLYNLTITQMIKYQNKIAVASNNGIYFITDPDSLLQVQNKLLPFYITSTVTQQGVSGYEANISLPFSKNRIVIKYAAVTFIDNELVKYYYRFTEKDTLWSSTATNELTLENLSPGKYKLQIRAGIVEKNRYSETITAMITIEKPWWQNNWFRLMAVLVSGTIIYYIISKRVQKIKKEEERKTALNARLTELEQTALRSQMNPHFIFNCLTSIQQLIISGNKLDANEYLVKFSRLIRKTLELSTQPFIAVREEKEYLEEYLSLEQLRLSGKFNFYITADPSLETDKIFIPNMMLQPIVENCVRHGIKPLENRMGSITIHFIMGKNAVTCTVTDNGVGRHNLSSFNEKVITKHKSYGMDIVRKRLETFSEYNVDESKMEIRDLFDNNGDATGTEVILQLPYKNIL